MERRIETALAVLNGAVGDYLVRRGNGLATAMALHEGGAPVPVERAALAAAYPGASGRIAVLLHGLMCTESIWDFADGWSYADGLRERGYTPLRVRYNSGRDVVANGALLCDLLAQVAAAWPVPVEEIVLVGYSMGGLVARSACGVAVERGEGWLGRVRSAFYIGTPHLGAPLERFGHLVTRVLGRVPDPYARLVGEIIDLRSQGVKDLRHGHHAVPLLPGIRHHLIAGSLSSDRLVTLLFGDALVPVASATLRGSEALPASQLRIIPEVSHLGLAHDHRVWEALRGWLEEPPDEAPKEAHDESHDESHDEAP